jgi:glycosyltransferase involved in cell wall biosynthesis
MRVGLVVFANKWTGAGAVAEANCRALRAVGVDARLLFVGGRNLERRLKGRPWAAPGLVKERLPTHVHSNMRAVGALSEECDIVVCHLPHDHLLCVAAGIHRHLPLVRAFRHPRHLRRDPYHRFLDNRLSAVLLAFSGLEEDLRRAHPELPALAPPVPLEDRFTPADGSGWRVRLEIPTGAPVLGMVGKLGRGRGFDVFLETAARTVPPIHVLIVGHGEAQLELEALATRLGIASRIRWVGYRDQALPEMYAAMDAVLFTAAGSDWGHRMISEAQGCGRPVVAAAIPGVGDLIDDNVNGRIVEGDPAALTNAVNSVIHDAETARRLGQAATASARNRWLAPVGEHLARFLEDVLSLT